MNKYTIHCAGISCREELHKALAEALPFPNYYGNNLDALYDCLMELGAETEIRLLDWDLLGDWKRGFEKVFIRAGLENPNLTIVL